MTKFVHIVDWSFAAFAVLRLLFTVHVWYRSQKLVPARSLGVIFDAVLSSRAGLLSLSISAFLCLGTPFIVYTLQWEGREPLILGGVLLGLSGIPILLRPPVVLVLGSSDHITRDLIGAVNSAAAPLRVVGLFNRERMMDSSLFFPTLLTPDNLRTWDDSMWKALVLKVINVVPMVIVDTRIATQAVAEETSWMLQPSNRSKTVFFAKSNGTAPALEAVGIWPGTDEHNSLRVVQDYDTLTDILTGLKNGS